MPSLDELVPLRTTRPSSLQALSPVPVHRPCRPPIDANTAVVTVEEAIKVPAGLRSFAGSEVTVRLRHPSLSATMYSLPTWRLARGSRSKNSRISRAGSAEPRWRLSALCRADGAASAGGVPGGAGHRGEVRPLIPPAERRGRVPWAMARFEIERVLKGRGLRQVTLVGPVPPRNAYRGRPRCGRDCTPS